MTDEDRRTGNGFEVSDPEFDLELSGRLRPALDAVGPSEEAVGRMLANLLAAQAARREAGDAPMEPVVTVPAPTGSAEPPKPATPSDPRPVEGPATRGRRRAAVGIYLAAAASIVLAVVVIGVWGTASPESSASMSADYAVSQDAPAGVDAGEASEDVGDATSGGSTEESAGGPSGGEEAGQEDARAYSTDEAGAFDGAGSLAQGYPDILLPTGERFVVETRDGLPVAVDPASVGDFLGEGTARSEDGLGNVPCQVYGLVDRDGGSYAVRFDDGTYWSASSAD